MQELGARRDKIFVEPNEASPDLARRKGDVMISSSSKVGLIIGVYCFADVIPFHWSAIVGEESLKINGSLKRSLEISDIYIHPEYRTNAPTYQFPSDYDVGTFTVVKVQLL